jgi:hypothetical protein
MFRWIDFLFGVLGILLYLVDIGSDLWLAHFFFMSEDYMLFAITLALVVVTYLFHFAMSLHTFYSNRFHGKWQWIPVLLGIMFNLGPCIA